MRLSLLAVLLIGCFPPPPHDCQTEGGMYVVGVECTDELHRMEQIIMEEVARVPGLVTTSLRLVSLDVRTKDLNDKGGFIGPGGYSVGGLTYCTGPLMIVARPDERRWEETALAHEAFHVFQGCPFDDAVYKECWSRYDHSSVSIQATCEYEANHPNWMLEIYPAIVRINEAKR